MSSVQMTGAVLADLLFEHSNALSDMEGLIFGTVTRLMTDTITDHSLNHVQYLTIYNISAFLPAQDPHSVFDWRGNVKEEEIKRMTQAYDMRELIGWYKLRRESSLQVSLRECASHKSFQLWLHAMHQAMIPSGPTTDQSGRGAIPSWERDDETAGLFLLSVASTTPNGALHTNEQLFMTRTSSERLWSRLPLTIANLSSVPKSTYKHCQTASLESIHGAYTDIVQKSMHPFIDLNQTDLPNVLGMKQLNRNLLEKLDVACERLSVSEMEVEKELQEVDKLRQQIAAIKDRSTKPSHPTVMPSLQDVSASSSFTRVQLEPDLINLEDDSNSAPNLMDISHVSTNLDPMRDVAVAGNGPTQAVNLTGTEFKRGAAGRTGASSKRGSNGSGKHHSLVPPVASKQTVQNPFGSLEDLGSHPIIPPPPSDSSGSPVFSKTVGRNRQKSDSSKIVGQVAASKNMSRELRSMDHKPRAAAVSDGSEVGRGQGRGGGIVNVEQDIDDEQEEEEKEDSSESDEDKK